MNQENDHDKNRKAIALSYSPDDPAPKVIAVGQGYLAEKIINSAADEKIPVHKDEKLTNSLFNLDIGNYIPPELYEVVAEILVFVDNMDQIKSKMNLNDLK